MVGYYCFATCRAIDVIGHQACALGTFSFVFFAALQEVLVNERVCTEAEANDQVKMRCLPVVGERQSHFEKTLEQLDVRCIGFICPVTSVFIHREIIFHNSCSVNRFFVISWSIVVIQTASIVILLFQSNQKKKWRYLAD